MKQDDLQSWTKHVFGKKKLFLFIQLDLQNVLFRGVWDLVPIEFEYRLLLNSCLSGTLVQLNG